MGQFLYFVAEARQARALLPQAFEPGDELTEALLFANGPSGGRGVLICRTARGMAQPAYRRDAQVWEPVSGADGAWIGMDPEARPGPSDLARAPLIDGHRVRLNDGNEWLVPAARCFPQGTRLPQALVLGAGGEWVAERLPEYARVSAHGDRIWQSVCVQFGLTEAPGDFKPVSVAEAADIAVEFLALNYRVGRSEVSMLKLLTPALAVEVLRAAVDWPTVERMTAEAMEGSVKKKPAGAPDGSPTGDGGAGS